jgi:hypothetical protein
MERICLNTTFSCAWVGDESTLCLPSTDGIEESLVDTYVGEMHSQAIRYWRERKPDFIGESIVGLITYPNDDGSPFSEVCIVGEDEANWVVKIIQANLIPSHQIAVIGGQIVKASTVYGKSRVPLSSFDIQSLVLRLRTTTLPRRIVSR